MSIFFSVIHILFTYKNKYTQVLLYFLKKKHIFIHSALATLGRISIHHLIVLFYCRYDTKKTKSIAYDMCFVSDCRCVSYYRRKKTIDSCNNSSYGPLFYC